MEQVTEVNRPWWKSPSDNENVCLTVQIDRTDNGLVLKITNGDYILWEVYTTEDWEDMRKKYVACATGLWNRLEKEMRKSKQDIRNDLP